MFHWNFKRHNHSKSKDNKRLYRLKSAAVYFLLKLTIRDNGEQYVGRMYDTMQYKVIYTCVGGEEKYRGRGKDLPSAISRQRRLDYSRTGSSESYATIPSALHMFNYRRIDHEYIFSN